jgi:ABC-type phosphate transport system substrate-binding protein
MKLIVAAATLALMTAPAFAQSSSSTSSGSQNSQANQNASDGSSTQTPTAVQKLKQTLEHEGFTDVKVVARSFVVQGKSPDGDPVVMTIGPHGMSVFEAMNDVGSGGSTTGSTGKTTGSSTADPSANSNSRMQK